MPEPTGPYPVGRVSYDWVNSARTEIYAANPEDRRELVVFVWYPAKPRLLAEFAPYLPPAWTPTAEFLGSTCGCAHMRSLRLRWRYNSRIRCSCCRPAASAAAVGAIAEELASHGFVVVG